MVHIYILTSFILEKLDIFKSQFLKIKGKI